MAFCPRVKTLAACVSVALAQFAASAARADSAVGVDTQIGGALDVGVARGSGPVDPEFEPLRSPVGRLYPRAPLVAEKRAKTEGGWEWDAEIELGGLVSSGDTSNVFFRRYKDVDDGFYARFFRLDADRRESAQFFEAYGGAINRDDQFYSLAFGRYNDWKLRAFYNETPSVFTSTFRSLWNGVGTDSLTLNGPTPGGLATAAQTQASLRDAIPLASEGDLALLRKKAGMRFDMTLGEQWKLYASYTHEKREGSRPYGMVFGGGGGGGDIEIPESIDNTVHEVLAGVRYNDPVQSFNFELSGSFFRNDLGTMTVQNPLTITTNTIANVPATTFTFARFDSDPDNDYYKAKAEYARALPALWNGRLTATVAAARSKQNDALIEPTLLPLTGGTINGIPAANVWNTTAALTKQNADAEIDTTLANVTLAVNPMPSLAIKGHVRYYATDNSTEYTACNPLTGQFGRLVNDGSGGAFVNTPAYLAARCDLAAVRALNVAPSAGNINIATVPFEYNQTNYGVTADYRITPKSNANLLLEREELRREHRERDKTWEDRIKAGYTNRALDGVTLLASYEHGRRRGSEYVVDPYEEFLSASMGPVPTATGTNMASWIHNIDTFRKFDLADRDQDIVNARVNWVVTPALDAGLTLQYKDMRYPDSAYGRRGTDDQTSVNLDVSYQPAAEWGVYGFYTWQNARMRQRGLQPNACLIGTTYYFYSNGAINTTGTAPAGATLVSSTQVTAGNWDSVCAHTADLSPLYPTSRTWENNQESVNHTFGIGGRYDFPKARLEASYLYVNGRSTTDYTYNADALGLTPAQVALIGSGMPDLVFIQNIFEASLTVPVTSNIAARLYYRYENGRVSDWHYDGVAQNPVPAANAAYLDNGPQNYRANVVGLFVRMGL
jgi:MtrB/PioB family decaheme-associated outer membrane protein